jgi:hypothetical protein
LNILPEGGAFNLSTVESIQVMRRGREEGEKGREERERERGRVIRNIDYLSYNTETEKTRSPT